MAGIPLILIVDDDPTTRALLQGFLQKEGYRVRTAADGPTGRSQAAQEAPDLILLDVNMPGESGFETCATLQADPATAATPILFLSAQDDLESKLKGLEQGAVDYITKPFQRAEVLARVRTHLRLVRMYHAWMAYQQAQLAQITEAQQAILPRPEDLLEARCAVRYHPLHEAGGDFFDILPAGEGITDYVVADVSGHDPGTSLATAALKVLLRQHASPLYSPLDTLRMINQAIRSVLQEMQYLTLVYARLNRITRTLFVASAGHPPAILVRQGQDPCPVEAAGDVLGVFEHGVFGSLELRVAPGDRFFLYSDGLLDSRGAGEHPVARLFDGCAADRSLEEVLAAIHANRLARGGLPQDDLCILGVDV